MPHDGSAPIIGPLTRELAPVVNSFNRPDNATPYDVGDAIANHDDAGAVVPLSWTPYFGCGTIRRVKITKSEPGTPATLRLWLFSAPVIPGAGDNAAFVAPLANLIDRVDVEVTAEGSDVAAGWAACDVLFQAATLYGLLTAASEFSPVAGETFTFDLTGYPG